ncbi:hypothetical protein IWQ60_009986 [Tieghemiomyces parasiticus]|uniref:Uncharacterized protein n=1 Tax=Tieghemiomyces parasiticus TaxID=78921 RepID=A0A9W8DP93_9FUNG|nr:hypothetical protein IWQ60_009986 [Tieghemiomyces parasiticus]
MHPPVRAVYDFEGQGPSSLSFRKGDIIEVHTQLDSGWWNGTCRNERGWFPSNYVELYQPEEATSPPVPTSRPHAAATTTHRHRGTGSNASTRSSPISPATPTTGTAAPLADAGLEADLSTKLTLSSPTRPRVGTDTSLPPSAVGTAALLTTSLSRSPSRTNLATKAEFSTSRPVSRLPPGWGIKSLPDGRHYYYHMVTDLTAWTLDGVDPDTGVRNAPGSGPTPAQSTAATPKDRRRGSGASTDSQSSLPVTAEVSMWAFNLQQRPHPRPRRPSTGPNTSFMGDTAAGQAPTWERLSANVVYAAQQLTNAGKADAKYEFLPLTLVVVSAVHAMFRASDTVERDAPIFRSQKLLKAHHRQVTNALCKVVVSAKNASVVWPAPDAVQVMQRDTNELLLAMRHFVIAAEESGVVLHPIDESDDAVSAAMLGNSYARAGRSMASDAVGPSNASVMTTETGHSQYYEDVISQRHLKYVDILSQMESVLHALAKALTLLLRHLRRGDVSLVRVITLAKKSVYEIGQFLLILEELDLELAGDALARQFARNKQALYGDVANMVMSIQAATQEGGDSVGVVSERVLAHTNALNNAVYEVLVTAKHVVEAMDNHEEELLVSAIDKLRGGSPTGSYADLSAQPRRAQSMPYLREQAERPVDRHLSAFEYSALRNNIRYRSNSSATTGPFPGTGEGLDLDNGEIHASDAQSVRTAINHHSHGGGPRTSGLRRSTVDTDSDDDEDDTYSRHNRSVSTINQRNKLKKFFGDEAMLGSGSTNTLTTSSTANAPEAIPGQPMGLPFANPTETKLAKFFGEQAPLHVPTTRAAVEEKPWFLAPDYGSGELVFTIENNVKGATLNALVERLTAHDVSDINFCNTFLLTYRSFTTTNEFLDLIIKRYTIQPPPGLKPDELEMWTERKLKPIRARVYNIIKMWLESHYVEDSDMDGLRMLREFACTTMADSMPTAAEQVVKSIDKRRQSSDGAFRKLVKNLPKQAPPPILPRSFRKLKVYDIHAQELARQFTILDSKVYNKIKSVECLNQAWMGRDPTRAVNIKAMVQLSTKVSLFVGGTILSEPELRKRGNLIKYFITVAEKCRELNNFNSLMSFQGGIELASVQRLRRTWDTLGTRTMATYESLKTLMGTNRNFVEYREQLHSCNPPCIPFLGTHLKDLVFVEDGNPDFLPNQPHLINFDKRTKVASVIRDLQSYQNTPYALTVVPEIQEFIERSLEEVTDSHGLYDISLTLEPREREDEKIARLLRESGFL